MLCKISCNFRSTSDNSLFNSSYLLFASLRISSQRPNSFIQRVTFSDGLYVFVVISFCPSIFDSISGTDSKKIKLL